MSTIYIVIIFRQIFENKGNVFSSEYMYINSFPFYKQLQSKIELHALNYALRQVKLHLLLKNITLVVKFKQLLPPKNQEEISHLQYELRGILNSQTPLQIFPLLLLCDPLGFH